MDLDIYKSIQYHLDYFGEEYRVIINPELSLYKNVKELLEKRCGESWESDYSLAGGEISLIVEAIEEYEKENDHGE